MAQITIDRQVLENVNNDDLITMLNEIIDSELSKNVEEIDTAFVNDCVDALLSLEQEENNFVALVPLVSSDKFLKSITKQNNKAFKNLNVFARTAIIAALIAGGTITANAMVQSVTGISLFSTIAQKIEKSISYDTDDILVEVTSQKSIDKATETTELDKAEEESNISVTEQTIAESSYSENQTSEESKQIAPVSTETNKTQTTKQNQKPAQEQTQATSESTQPAEITTENPKNDLVISAPPAVSQISKERSLVNISADISSFKTDYIYGESFDVSGIKLYANYDDETSEEISINDCYYSKIIIRNVTADYSFKIIYKTCSLDFNITVRPDEDTRGSKICTSNDYDYLLTDFGAYITSYKGSNTNLIMNTVDGNKIVAITANVFSNNNVTEVYSKNVKKIFDYAFKDCKNLKSADFPNAVYIGDYAFDGAESLSDLTISEKAEKIGKYALSKTKLEKFELSENITAVPEGLFDSCEELKAVDFKGNVSEIGKNAFSDCTALESISGAQNIKKVCSYAFYNDEKLNFDVFPISLVSVGECGFFMCQSLDIGEFPDTINEVDKSSFAYCTKLTSITIPSSMKVIAYEAFRGTGAKTIILNEGVEVIEDYAFRGVKATSIILPESLKSIGSESLYSPLFRKIYFGKSIEELADDAFYKGKSVTFYVYEDTLPMQWAVDNNVKYVLQ